MELLIFSFQSISAPLDRNPRGRGQYTEYLPKRGFPFTFQVNSFGTDSTINFFKHEIITKAKCQELYRFIFEERYNATFPAFNRNEIYKKSLKAKLAAFIYMMGLKYNSISKLVEPLPDYGDPIREQYATEALTILKDIKITNVRGWYFNGIDRQRYRAFELLNYLQAYDYLKTAKSVLQNESLDSETAIKEKIMDFTYELHAAANNPTMSYDRNNNISLIVASAVGTSAIFFANEGAGRLQIQRHPERWAHAAHAYITKTLFEGQVTNDEGPMLNKDGVTFYGEGSHYFTYAWQSMLVFMKTYYRAKGIESLTDGSDPGGREYNPCKLCSKVKTESYNSKNYQNLYKGYIESLDQKGWHPALDDTWIPEMRFAPLLILGDNRYTPYFKDFDSLTNFDYKKLDFDGPGERGSRAFEADVLLTQFKRHFEGKPSIVNYPLAGYTVLSEPKLYVNLNCERANMIKGGFHEHGDVSNIEIRAGQDLKPMVIDPYFFGQDGWKIKGDVDKGSSHNCILVDGDGPHPKDMAESSFGRKNDDWIKPDGSKYTYYTLQAKVNYWNRFSQWNMRTAITRKLSVFSGSYFSYIIIEDDITNNSISKNDIVFKLNGNGLEAEGNFYLRDNNQSAIWS
ncbi:MAG: hypothetical protein FGM41_00635 [Bacteroidetes bacterium]|nr:hypothetical protein [Bacteroidota bacterium]